MAKKEKKLDTDISDADLIAAIQKEVGAGDIRLGINSGGIVKIDTISTRCLPLDIALGIGGIPRGRTTEIFGAESSGKTTLALTITAECQSNGGRAAYIDVEHAIDPVYAGNIGVNLDKLIFSQPDSGDKAMKICKLLVESGKIDLIVIDSVAALVTQDELDGEINDHNVAGIARLMSKSLRMLTAAVNKSKTSLVFINQTRDKIGVMFGNPSISTGGKALKYYASIRMEISRIASVNSGDSSVGNRTRVKIIKNKLAPPFKVAEFDVIFGKGISIIGGVVEAAIKSKIIEKSGSWLIYNGNKLGMGITNAIKFFEKCPDVLKSIQDDLRALTPEPTIEEKDIGEEGDEDGDDGDEGVEVTVGQG